MSYAESLRLAADAAELRVVLGRDDTDSPALKPESLYTRGDDGVRYEWDPICRYEQCMWLVCKLRLGLEFGINDCRVMHGDYRGRVLSHYGWQPNTPESLQHKRICSAIVEAAAEISRATKLHSQISAQ